jgi:uncharacterized membrane protein YgcG
VAGAVDGHLYRRRTWAEVMQPELRTVASAGEALGAGILSFCPARMEVVLRSFMAMIFLTLVPCAWQSWQHVAGFYTTYNRSVAGGGIGGRGRSRARSGGGSQGGRTGGNLQLLADLEFLGNDIRIGLHQRLER